MREYRVTVVIFIKDPFSHLSCSYRGFSSHLFKKKKKKVSVTTCCDCIPLF